MTKQHTARWVNIDAIQAWDKNPRNNEHAVQSVADSIERFGWGSPIIARKSDGVVIAGHTRLKAAQRLKMDKVLVRYLDLDPAEAAALALADNKIGELADWDDGGLRAVLLELDAEDVNLDGLGFSDEELDAMLTAAEMDLDGDTDTDHSSDDDLPEDPPALTKPGEVIQIGRHTLHCADCVEVLRGMDDDSVDAIVTDPPYGIGFMGKGWDVAVPGDVFAAECLRVLKPGGHIIAFAATRTIHRLMTNFEDAGFEIRDLLAWLQWQGFPKSMDVSKAIDKEAGATRKIISERPAYGIGQAGRAFNGHSQGATAKVTAPATPEARRWSGWGTALKPAQEPAVLARKPLDGTVAQNVLKWGTGGLNIDGCRYGDSDTAWPGPSEGDGRWPANIYHCPKPSRSEREDGCDDLPSMTGAQAVDRKQGSAGIDNPRAGAGRTAEHVRNHHPTVKPIRLMRWLVRLVTPPGGVLVEPFGGSGTTLIAAEREGFACVSAELEPKYCDIIRARLSAAVDGE